jgi:hypothetical protein
VVLFLVLLPFASAAGESALASLPSADVSSLHSGAVSSSLQSGLRCLRVLAARRLEQLYGPDELDAF